MGMGFGVVLYGTGMVAAPMAIIYDIEPQRNEIDFRIN